MNFLPPPLDNLYVLIAVIIGLVILGFAVQRSRAAKAQLEQTRKDKAKRLREAKAKAAEKNDN